MNPYAAHLGAEDPVVVIGKTPARLTELLNGLGADYVNQAPAPGKWSPREVVAHLADCEAVFGFRIRQTLAEDGPVIQPFDQDRWAARNGVYSAAAALAAFNALRAWNVTLIGSLNEADMARKVTHPERGTMTLQTIIETMAGHDLNHLKQLDAMARRATAEA
jgi:hypothetical protein